MPRTAFVAFPVGTAGQPWGAAEKAQWLARQSKKRDYFTDVVSRLMRLNTERAEVYQYGELDYRRYGAAKFPLLAVRSAPWDNKKPMVVVTGGVHGYETSGVHGALEFITEHLTAVADQHNVNVLVLPCISPWGYEMIHRWTPEAVDPNRQFNPENPGCPEAAQAMAAIAAVSKECSKLIMHVDCHETTDTDNSEFEPTKIARDGIEHPKDLDPIPDGFYLVADLDRPAREFQKAMIDAVAKVTHIAEADEEGNLIGIPMSQRGVIDIPVKGICGKHTGAQFVTTTEVYPDSPHSSPEICNKAQVACVLAGIDYAVAHHAN